jgi:hypothetical protein
MSGARIHQPVRLGMHGSSVFHSLTRGLFKPPQSAVIVRVLALGKRSRPRCSHQARIEATANCAVSAEIPTLTHPSSLVMS